MQKLSLLPLFLVTGIGAVWASTLMFPNTTEFPRSPGGPGTISGALALFGADGSALNTDQLNGLSASGYLQNRDCSTEVINKIWVGVDADGRAICGTRGVLIGYLTEGSSISITRGASPSTAISIGDPLYAGDIVSTTAVGTGTIRFAADESILRLDTSTVVELSVGTLGSNSVAQAILSDGRLWGRILTSTGVNLGGGGLVAGVRGTSVSVERPGTTGPYLISVIDSIRPLDAATLSAISGSTIPGSPTYITAGSQISVDPSAYLAHIDDGAPVGYRYLSTTKTTLLTDSPWIRDNTRADIDYLYTNSGVTPRVLAEYSATISLTTPATILDALCPDTGATTRSYWTSLIPYTRYLDKCRESTLLAFASYTGSADLSTTLGIASPLIFSGSSILATGTWSRGVDGYSITATGQYISYAPGAFDRIGGLAGKRITITVGTLPNSTTSKTLVDFGGGLRIKTTTGGGYSCLWSLSNCVTVDSTFNTLTFTVPSTIIAFVIGNNISIIGGLTYNTPIGVTVRKIQITN